jgi:hypothetical protein
MKKRNIVKIGIGLLILALFILGAVAVSGVNSDHPWDGTRSRSPGDEHPWEDDHKNTDKGDPWDGTNRDHPCDGTYCFDHPWDGTK